MSDARVPAPGSDAAVRQCCTCAVLDNCHGEGYAIDRATGEPMFVIREDCPLHSPTRDTPTERTP